MSNVVGRLKYRATIVYPLPEQRVPTSASYTLGWVDATEWAQLDRAIVEHIQNLIPFKGDITVDVFLSQALEPINGGRWVPIQEQVFRAWHEADGYHYANCGCEVIPAELNGGILPALFPHQFNLEAGHQV